MNLLRLRTWETILGIGVLFLLISEVQLCALDDSKALPDVATRARDYVRSKLVSRAPGVSAAVALNGKIVWSEGFGYADLEAKAPVTSRTLFRIGSVSKPFTAAGLLLLAEKGKLDLDTDIRVYVPSFPDKDQRITLRQLAGHLGGIRHYEGEETFSNKPYATVTEGLKIFQDDPLVGPPGEAFAYSSYGWNLLSAAMESAAEQDFLSYMDAAVFRPLNMKNSMPDFAQKEIPARTQFYVHRQDGQFVRAPNVDNSYKWAGGGFISNPEDMVTFGMAHLQPGFLKADSLQVLFTSQRTKEGKQTGYGVGWMTSMDAKGHRVHFHTGSSVGGVSVLLLHPASKVVVAITANCSDAGLRKEDSETLAELFAATIESK